MPQPATSTLTKVAEVGGSLKQVQQAFQAFQVARNQFVNQLSAFLDKKDPANITLEALMKNDIMAVLCCPLAQDPVPGIQSLALSCLSKLSGVDPLLSQVVVSCGVLDSVVVSMSHESAPVQAAADGVLSSVARSTVDFAGRVLAAGAMQPLMQQLQSSPPVVKEAAVRMLSSLILSSEEHAQAVCDDNLLSVLVALMKSQDSPPSLCKAVVVTLGNIAAVAPQLAEALVAQQALPPLCLLVRGGNTPPDLKAAALATLAHVCRHHEGLANKVVQTGVVQAAVQSLSDRMMPPIRRNAGGLLLQLSQKTPELAEVVTSNGAPACLKQFMALEKEQHEGLLVGCMIVGSMASYKASIAKALIDAGANQEVTSCVRFVSNQALSGTAAWALEQMAQHGEETTMPLVEKGALTQLIDAFAQAPAVKNEYQAKLKSAIKALIRNCVATGNLETFVAEATPPQILKHVLRRLLPLLEGAPKARQQFVTSGALMRLQRVIRTLCEKGREYADAINALFPEDVVAYYAAGATGPPPRPR